MIVPKVYSYIDVRYLDRVQVMDRTTHAIWLRFEDDQDVFQMAWPQYRESYYKGYINIPEGEREEWTP